MHRFVALFWDKKIEERTLLVQRWCESLARSSTQWVTLLEEPGMLVLAMKSSTGALRAAPFTGAKGVAIGVVHERGREDAGPVVSISPALAQRTEETAGDALLKEMWGHYVAIWRDKTTYRATVLRDPSGAVSCFMAEAGGVRLLFSFAEDVAGLEGLTFSIDWNQVRAFLHHNYFATKHTGLAEVSELMPGERMTWTGDDPAAFAWAWDPITIAANPDRRGFDDLCLDVRKTMASCAKAWAGSYRSIVLQLSGGLDSSILLALLNSASGARVTPMHTVSAGYEGYERELARLAAEHTRLQLVERSQDARASDLRNILDAPRLARPARQIIGIQANRLIAGVCEEVEADAVVAGHGGDTLFLQRSLASNLAADCLRVKGPGADVLRIAYDQATLEQRSVWAVLGETAGDVIRPRGWRPYAFLDDVSPNAPRPLAPIAESGLPSSYWMHPWIDSAVRLPPGKRDQVLSFIGLYNYFVLYGYGVTLDAINPYQSQPIIELALRIPTYQFVRGGRDRALQRAAFGSLIPERIARRTGKGLINHQLLVAVARNASFLRELVLDGDIVRQDWIDRQAAEALFSEEQLLRGSGLMSALGLVSAEAWLQGWRKSA